jgi:hypothetical protein
MTYKETAADLDSCLNNKEEQMNHESIQKWRSLLLGAANGLIYSLTLIPIVRLFNEYQRRRDLELAEGLDVTIQVTYDHINWKVAILWYVLLFAIASYLVHRHWSKHVKSSILRWIVIALMAVGSYNLIVIGSTLLQMLITGHDLPYRVATSSLNIRLGTISLALAIVTTPAYAAVARLFSPGVAEQKLK